MKKINSFTIFFAAIFILFSTSCGKDYLKDDYGCFVNYEDALDYAGKKKLPVLLMFTSQGDDDESTQLVTQVMQDEGFAKDVLKKYVVCHADFSQDAFEKMNAPEGADQKQQELANTYTTVLQNNYQLAMLFGIEAMPAVFLCTKEGYVVTEVEYDDLPDIADFMEALQSCDDALAAFDKMVAQTQKGSVASKVEAIDTLYLATDPGFRTFLLPLVQLVPELDKNNETGLVGKYIVASAEAQALSSYSKGDVETAVKQYLSAADNEFVKAEDKQECFYTAAYLAAYSGSEDYEGILSYLETAYNLAPESSKAPAIQDAMSYFKTIIDNIDDYNQMDPGDAK